MKRTLEGSQLMLAPLSQAELIETEGGTLPGWLKALSPLGAALILIDNWKDIKKGIVDGFNADHWQ